MKTESFARMGLTIAALALASGLVKAASTTSAAPSAEPQCAGHAPSHTLFLRDAKGNDLRLVLCRGSSWKYLADMKSRPVGRSLAQRKIKFSPIAEAQAETAAPPAEYPLAVFVDGPSGYTFAWTRDAGWKYVGYLTDEAR